MRSIDYMHVLRSTPLRLLGKAVGVLVVVVGAVLFVHWWTSSASPLTSQSVARQWNQTIRQLGIEPVYPPQEDISVGDIFLIVTKVRDYEGSEVTDSPLARRTIKLWHKDLADDLEKLYQFSFTFPRTVKRTPTFVYVDEAADYFDRNIGLILAQARKYNVGMVLAHQYLGQLEPKLQEAFGANTSIKFAGGVSNKDARSLAPMLGCEPAQIEAQPKGTFMASIRGVTKSVLPLRFPFGRMENGEQMTGGERAALQDAMRARYAVHHTALATSAAGLHSTSQAEAAADTAPDRSSAGQAPTARDVSDDPDTSARPEW